MSSAPMRIKAGFTQAQPYQPLNLIGMPNPLWYIDNHDDFTAWVAGRYTLTNTGNGTIAGADGDGGRVLFTTNSTTPAGTDVSSMQSDSAAMVLNSSKKMGFMVRAQLADVTNPAFVFGKMQKTTTPFTVTDGIVFQKASGSTTINVNVVSGSTVQATAAIPATALTLANATDFDLAWEYDGRGTLLIYAAPATNGFVGTQSDQVRLAVVGPCARLDLSALTLSAANLCATLAIQSGTATSKTMNADFFYAAKER